MNFANIGNFFKKRSDFRSPIFTNHIPIFLVSEIIKISLNLNTKNYFIWIITKRKYRKAVGYFGNFTYYGVKQNGSVVRGKKR